MPVAVVLTVVVASGAVGLAAHQRLRRTSGDAAREAAEGLDAAALLFPLRTLVALVVAFVLVQTFESYRDAEDATGEEAGAVTAEAEAAALLPPPASGDLAGSLRCYARAVAGPGWASLDRVRRTSPVVDQAAARVQAALGRARTAGADPTVWSAVLTADRDRIAARRRRLADAEPSVPAVVMALLIGRVAITVAESAALADRRLRTSLRLALVGATTVVFTAMLLVIFDLDRPFGGLAAIRPVAIANAERRIGAHPSGADAPCDASGLPSGA